MSVCLYSLMQSVVNDVGFTPFRVFSQHVLFSQYAKLACRIRVFEHECHMSCHPLNVTLLNQKSCLVMDYNGRNVTVSG